MIPLSVSKKKKAMNHNKKFCEEFEHLIEELNAGVKK